MSLTDRGRLRLAAGASAAALLACGASAAAQTAEPDTPVATRGAGAPVVEALVVTAQRREEQVLAVPMAVSAFSGQTLTARRIEGGQDLLLTAPNLNYGRGNFGGYNLSIRGIGSKFVGNSGEYGVSVHENATPITYNRLADAEYFDVERVEVLRGPQGTLYGRNATGGAINIITARPTDRFGGFARAEYGSFDTRRLEGALNIPLTDMLAVRWAGFAVKRDGYGRNLATGQRLDGRDIQASRLSLRVRPNEVLDLNLLWEHFNEKDDRLRAGKQLCVSDPGPSALAGVPVSPLNRNLLSQGCLPGPRYSAQALGAVNSAATLTGMYLPFFGLAPGNVQPGKVQTGGLRDVESPRNPIYDGRQNFFQIDARLALTRALTFETLTGFNYDRGYSYQDYNRVAPTARFATTGLASALFPGGVVADPQLGPSDVLKAFDYYPVRTKEFTQELRLWSDFAGPLNFSLGAFHSEYEIRADYYIFSNGLTAFAQVQDALAGRPNTYPVYVDPTWPPTAAQGHNYYVNSGTNHIESNAVFGELYWRPTADLRLIAGLRLTHDYKRGRPDPVTLLAAPTEAALPPASGQVANPAFNGGRGRPPAPTLTRNDHAPTGRLTLEWTPDFGFTDRTLVYAAYSRGYKAGGFNTPCDPQSPGCAGVPRAFAPEYVDAYEIGTKNVLAGGAVVLNLTGFHYDYQGYQVAAIINKASVNQNVDAAIDGVEFEAVWEPVRRLRLNLDAGWLRTAIKGGAFIDTLDRTQGNPALSVIKAQDASNCVVNRAALANLLAVQQGEPGAPAVTGITGAPTALLGACSGLLSSFGLYDYAGLNVATAPISVDNAPRPNSVVQVGQGVPVSIDGRRLPNAPDWTVAFGAQYRWDLRDWRLTLRGDYYRQGDSYARIFNTVSDRLKGYQVVNAALSLAQPRLGLEVQLYVKNLTDEEPITNLYLTDDSSGLFTNTFTLDPRRFGLAVTQRF